MEFLALIVAVVLGLPQAVAACLDLRERWRKRAWNACVRCTNPGRFPDGYGLLVVAAPPLVNPLPEPDRGRCVVYLRVSSAEQASEGYGLDAQEAACMDFARREGLEIAAAFRADERSTVFLDERPVGSAALDAMLALGAGTLLLAHRDRLARDPYVAGHAKRAVALLGGRIAYAEGGNGDSDGDLLMDDIGHAIAAHERRRIVARLRAGREAKAAAHPGSQAQGGALRHGYGRDGDGMVQVDPSAAAEVVTIFELCRDGRSVRAIARAMEQTTGRRWHPTTVERILSADVYKRARPGRIVGPRTWNAAQRAREGRRRR